MSTLQLEKNVGSMEIEESGYVICSHSNPLESSNSKRCIRESPYIASGCCDYFTYADWYAWLMHSKDTYARVEIQDIVAHFLKTSKDLSVGEMLGGLLGPCNSHHILRH